MNCLSICCISDRPTVSILVLHGPAAAVGLLPERFAVRRPVGSPVDAVPVPRPRQTPAVLGTDAAGPVIHRRHCQLLAPVRPPLICIFIRKRLTTQRRRRSLVGPVGRRRLFSWGSRLPGFSFVFYLTRLLPIHIHVHMLRPCSFNGPLGSFSAWLRCATFWPTPVRPLTRKRGRPQPQPAEGRPDQLGHAPAAARWSASPGGQKQQQTGR